MLSDMLHTNKRRQLLSYANGRAGELLGAEMSIFTWDKELVLGKLIAVEDTKA
ncbi:hypothetical protein TcasGA2_TC011146 [Tribolium castaneum]|uniref:Uncharacterized protein n=1 Tax=Tribolium castaneum TaxID=7070 RepID=D6X423_TRICA|nr:hypothetical protein TcasGA2_TC011146 [Tribolium castaneum]